MEMLIDSSGDTNDRQQTRGRAAMAMKTGALALTAAAMLAAHTASAATVTTFAALDALVPSDTKAANTTFAVPASDTTDFTFEFTFTTPTTLTANVAILEFGGTNGTSLFLKDNRLVFRSGISGGALMYVTSYALNASTQYNVIGSLFNSPTNTGDFMRLYVNRADGVDATQLLHDPDDTVNDFWGANSGGYGDIGGGDVQVGTTVGAGNGASSSFDSTNGTLDTGVDFFNDTYVNIPIPEPGSLALLGLGTLCLLRRRRD